MLSTINSLKHVLRQHFSSHWKCLSSMSSPQTPEMGSVFGKERDFSDLTVDTFKELVTDDTVRDKIETILSEYEYEKYTTLQVPTTITTTQMKDLLCLNDSLERKRWLTYLCKRQKARHKSNEKRKNNSIDYLTRLQQKYSEDKPRTGLWDNDHQLVYGLWHNTLFTKIPVNHIKRHYVHRLRNAALFGQKVVIDLDFDDCMRLSETRLLAQQIHLLYNFNRYQSREPFDLHFTNCKPWLPSMQAIPKYLPKYLSPGFMAEFHKQSYVDLFPKDKLVYLTPNADTPLKTYNYDDIYVIGGLIDKSYHQPVTLTKATKEGIRTARLPIDEHIIWASGSKFLCLNHVVQILHDMSVGSDWTTALRDNIPKRKQKSVQEIEFEDMLRKQKYNRYKKHDKNNYI